MSRKYLRDSAHMQLDESRLCASLRCSQYKRTAIPAVLASQLSWSSSVPVSYLQSTIMKFIFAVLSAFALASAVVSGSSVPLSPSLLDTCGEGGKVLEKNSIEHDGKTIEFVSTTCPKLKSSANATELAALEKRQTVCSEVPSACSIQCQNLSSSQPFMSDCQVITNYLESFYPASFSSPAGTYQAWSYYSCTYAFLNLDTINYSVCYLQLGYNAAITSSDCFGDWPAPSATKGATCNGPMTSGQKWEIAVLGN
ncbi:hypothetical protein BC834DRAFT_265197 [Gloeopeniophorella convolvens]|nr:hypothetical protein BC834DRAFT_265197 [Gloeopeniophorella convolvens]